MASIELGLGLLSIGRTWGVKDKPPPSEAVALALIEAAHRKGIRFFDTAPAYATSELRLGKALLNGLVPRGEVTIATKMGEHWDQDRHVAFPDHSYDQLARSLETSLERLQRIDVLQLHKATTETITAADVIRALGLARSFGIRSFGASVSDLDTAKRAIACGLYDVLQFPFNQTNTMLEPVFALLSAQGMKAIVNRPFAMGALVGENGPASRAKALSFVVERQFSGIILTGTSSLVHLSENIAAFREVNDAMR